MQLLPKTLLTQEISEGLLPSLMKIEVSRISMKDYELFYCDKEKLKVCRYYVDQMLVMNFCSGACQAFWGDQGG